MPVGNHLPHGETAQGGPLKRELGERHIRLMALGACIGVGLLLGSAKAIDMAGPAIMISYILGGLAILVIMRALGEMAVHNPVAGSFSRYAQDYLGPLAGFLTGWNYWFLWLVTCVAEITAVAVYMGIWVPDVPRWIWALAKTFQPYGKKRGGADYAVNEFKPDEVEISDIRSTLENFSSAPLSV